jgi:hypothetical protein
MHLSVKARTIAWFLLAAVAIYMVIILVFGYAYYSTGSIGFFRATTRTMEQIDFMKALYFSVVSFHTIGYGDIYPISQQGRMILMTQSFVSLFYTSVFAGMLVYFIIKRHADIFTTRFIYIRTRKDKWHLSIRLGNRSRPIIGLTGKFEAWHVENDSRVRVYTYAEEMSDLENILYFDIALDDPSAEGLKQALTEALNSGRTLHMKFNFIGNDIKSGEQVARSVHYDSSMIRFGRIFLNVYSWDSTGHRTDFRWGNFEKIEPASDEEIARFKHTSKF